LIFQKLFKFRWWPFCFASSCSYECLECDIYATKF